MSIGVMSKVWELTLPDSQKIVLLALADCANDEGYCWPSMATLAKKCSKGQRTIQGVIKQLVDAGHLTRNEVLGKGCNYYVHPRSDCAPAASAPPQRTAQTPAAAADKPSRTIIKKKIDAHEIPNGWLPKDFGVGTQSRNIVDDWSPGTLAASIEGFTAHHRARGNKFKDWQDAWSTWVLNSRKFQNGKQNGTGRTQQRSTADLGRDVAAQLEREAAASRGGGAAHAMLGASASGGF